MRDLFFDLDGTLTDPKPGITRSIVHALEALGLEAPDPDSLTWAIGPALVDTFPLLALEVPRDGTGAVRTDRMPEAEEATFGGVVGHLHVSTQKLDPGPAFDWERYLGATRALTR